MAAQSRGCCGRRSQNSVVAWEEDHLLQHACPHSYVWSVVLVGSCVWLHISHGGCIVHSRPSPQRLRDQTETAQRLLPPPYILCQYSLLSPNMFGNTPADPDQTHRHLMPVSLDDVRPNRTVRPQPPGDRHEHPDPQDRICTPGSSVRIPACILRPLPSLRDQYCLLPYTKKNGFPRLRGYPPIRTCPLPHPFVACRIDYFLAFPSQPRTHGILNPMAR